MRALCRNFFLGLGAICLLTASAAAVPLAHNSIETPNDFIPHRVVGTAAFRVGPPAGGLAASEDTSIDATITEFSANVPGSSLNITRGADLSGASNECSDANVNDLINDPPADFTIFICPGNAFTEIGLSAAVLGATVTETVGSTVAQATILIRDGLNPADFLHVLLHEMGHAIGLDHTTRDTNDINDTSTMFPVVLVGTMELHEDDLFAVQSLYATDPENPGSMFPAADYGQDGACISGRVENQDGVALSGVVMTAHDNNIANTEIITAVSGLGFDSGGNANGPGEYTLCFPLDITHVTAQLCDILVGGPINQTIVCGGTLTTTAQTLNLGGNLQLMGQILMPYVKSGNKYVYNDSGTVGIDDNSELNLGTMLTPTSGNFTNSIDFVVQAELNPDLVPLPTNNGFFFVDEGPGCQAISPGSPARVDLAMAFVLLLPLAVLAIFRQKQPRKVPVRSRRRFKHS